MKCSLCGGLVTWRGPLSDLTHTECERCGERNCQEPEWPEPDGSEHADGVAGTSSPKPFAHCDCPDCDAAGVPACDSNQEKNHG